MSQEIQIKKDTTALNAKLVKLKKKRLALNKSDYHQAAISKFIHEHREKIAHVTTHPDGGIEIDLN